MVSEAKRAYMREYYKRNKQTSMENHKIWRENNDEYYKSYRENNKEELKAYKQTPAGRKSTTISNWKSRYGLIDSDGDNYQKIYEAYIATTHCDVCRVEFKDSRDRCLDHDHDTGLFRQFLCRDCNIQDRWEKKLKLFSLHI